MPKTITFRPNAEQSVLLVGTQTYGNSQNLSAPIGYIPSDDALYRDLIDYPIEWPADMWQIKDAWISLTPSALDLQYNHHVGFGADPQVEVELLSRPFHEVGGTLHEWRHHVGDGPIDDSDRDWATAGSGTGDTASPAPFGNPNASQKVHVAGLIEAIAPTRVKKRNGSPCEAKTFYGVAVRSNNENNNTDRWGYVTNRASPPGLNRPNLTIVYDATVPPGVPSVVSPEPGGDPTIVPSPTGRTLTVEFVSNIPAGDTTDRVELEVYADGATCVEDEDQAQPVTGTRELTTGSVVPTPTGQLNRFKVTITGIPPRPATGTVPQHLYRLRVRNQKGAWGRWTVLAEGRIQVAYIPGVPIDPRMTNDPQRPRIGATLNSQDPHDGVTGFTGVFLRHNSDGTTTNLWPGLTTIAINYVDGTTRAEVDWGGVGLNDGDRVSWKVALFNRDGVQSPFTAEQTTVMHTSVGPAFTPADTNTPLQSRTGPVVITEQLEFEAYRFRLYRNDVLIYTSPIIASGPDLTASITLPMGILNWGDTFGIEAETRPTNTTEFGPTSPRATLYIDTLPSVGAFTASDGDGFTGPVLPTTDIVWEIPYADPDKERYGEKPTARLLEVRHYAAVPSAGAIIDQRLALASNKVMTEQEESGFRILPLTSATGWVGDTNVTPGTAAQQPTDYVGNSLSLVFASSSTDRGARYTFPEPLDLSDFSSSTRVHIWARLTSEANLTDIRLRFESSPTDYIEWALYTSASDSVNTWYERAGFMGYLTAFAGSIDWSSIVSMYVRADVTGAFAATLYLRDLFIGWVATQAVPPDDDQAIVFEESYNARARYRDGASALITPTTLAAAASATDTNVKVTSVVGLVAGQDLTIGLGGDQETRLISTVGTSGSGGTGVTLAEALLYDHPNGANVTVWPWGPWSGWLTEKASEPPVVVAVSPADAATVTDPTQDFVFTFTSPASKGMALHTLNLYKRTDGEDRLVYERDTLGTATTETAPLLFLEDATDYAWEVVGYDSDGLPGVTARRSFTTDFTVPDPVEDLEAAADPGHSTVTLTWTASTDPNFAFYVVRWTDPDGQPLRVDLGPREVDDHRVPVVEPTFTYRGARLGSNRFAVTVHNGAQESDSTEVDVVLAAARPGAAMLVFDDDRGLALPLELTSAPRTWTTVIETMRPPGRPYPVHFHWGLSGRHVTLGFRYLPSLDGPVMRQIGSAAGNGDALWAKLPPGYDWDVMRGRIASAPTDTAQDYGWVDASADIDETAPEAPV